MDPQAGGRTMSWTRMQMAERLVREFQDGWVVNLGVGMPTMIADVPMGDRDIIFHAENGVIGYGAVCTPGTEDLNLVNAGGQNVMLNPGASIVHHADSFALIRGGRMDVTVMGAYEVAANGDFANWKLKGAKGGGIGGAMDLAASAQRVFIMLEHRTRDGASRLLPRCSLPITAAGVVTLVVTDLGLFAPLGEGFALRDLAPGVMLEEVRAATACPIIA
jgi:3-oxoacid CoA-transferase B subunit